MRHLIVLLSFMMVAILTDTTSLSAQNAQTPPEPLRLLLVWGGHGYDAKALHAMLEAIPGAKLTVVELTRENGKQSLFKPGLEKEYDCVVWHDQSRFPLTDEEKENFQKLWKTGIPTVMLHHAFIAHTDWTAYRDYFGGMYVTQKITIDGTEYSPSKYKQGVTFPVTIADKNHPITKGIDDFELTDEVFGDIYVHPKAHVLLTTDHPLSSKTLAWTWQCNASPVFAITPGHDKHAFENPTYRTLVERGIRWVVEQKKSQKGP